MRLPRPLLLAALCASTHVLNAQDNEQPLPVRPTTVPAASNPEELIGPMRLPDTPLELVLQNLEAWTGRIIIRPQALPATAVTLNIHRAIPKSEAIQALVTVLGQNNIGVVEMGDKYLKIVELTKARGEAPELISGSLLGLPPSGKVAAKVFELKNLKAQDFVGQLNTLLTVPLGGAVLFTNTNAFLVTDSIANLQRVEQLIDQLDVPAPTNFTTKYYRLNNAKASDLVSRVKQMLQNPGQQALGNSLSLNADDRTNQIILIADPKQHAFFDDLISKLDLTATPNTRNEVIRLNNADAKEVATILTTIITGQNTAAQKAGANSGVRIPGQPATPATPAPNTPNAPAPAPAATTRITTSDNLGGDSTQFSSLLTVTADGRSNAIVVSGTVDDIKLIRDLIEKIDVVLPQVRIEVVVAEVTLSNVNETGISALGLKVDGNKLTGISVAGPGASLGGSGPGAEPSSGAGISGLNDLKGVINLTSNSPKTKAVVLANPTLVTSHAKEARIFVGESRPAFGEIRAEDSVGSGNSSSPTALRSAVTQQKAGIELKIKPLIGADGSVQLEITQNYDAFGAPVDLGGGLSQAAINQRQASSYITVADGEIIVLGGYRTQAQEKSQSRLGPIPIIGDLLGSRKWSKNSTELMLFVRPHVIRGLDQTTADAKTKINTSTQRVEIERSLEISAPVPPELPAAPEMRRGPR